MERELWRQLYRLLIELAPRSRPRGHVFSDRVIAACYAWAVLHERPVSWACRRGNWPADLLTFSLPSVSTLSRRLRSTRVRALTERVEADLRGRQPRVLVRRADSKPLPVGTYSRCPDARWGEAVRTKLRGYKLFAINGGGTIPDAWDVSSMNASDARVTRRLLYRLPPGTGGYLLADSAYDVNHLHATAASLGIQLLAPRKRPDRPVCRRKPQHPARLRSIDLLEGPGRFGRQLYRLRTQVERDFARLTGVGGLFALPNWVRGLRRVRQYVQMKLILLSLRPFRTKRLAA
jgi:hypothetical protein